MTTKLAKQLRCEPNKNFADSAGNHKKTANNKNDGNNEKAM